MTHEHANRGEAAARDKKPTSCQGKRNFTVRFRIEYRHNQEICACEADAKSDKHGNPLAMGKIRLLPHIEQRVVNRINSNPCIIDQLHRPLPTVRTCQRS